MTRDMPLWLQDMLLDTYEKWDDETLAAHPVELDSDTDDAEESTVPEG